MILSFLLFIALLLCILGALKRIRTWRQGKPKDVKILAGLSAIPRRYLVDLHHVVARDRYMSNTHVATAGGFVASIVLLIFAYLVGVNNSLINIALLLSTAVMFNGAVFVFLRRRKPMQRLSRGPWMRLPKSLLIFSGSVFLVSLFFGSHQQFFLSFGAGLIALVLLAGIVWGLGELLFGMTWGGPMKHAFAGALHLAFHPRSERFGGGRSTGLKLQSLDAEKFGVEKPQDFYWNQLLGFDACVQCGRCEQACPAFAAGQPLNPKKLIQDMVVGMTGGTDAHYAGSPYPGEIKKLGEAKGNCDQPIFDTLLHPETLWSCTTCRACVEECPMMIEHVDAVVDMRRFLTMEKGQTPGKGAEVLENLIATDNPSGYAPQKRMHWAADQNLPVFQDVEQAEVLLWIGDAAFDMRNQQTLKAVVKLLRAAEINFAVLGDEELDCGDVARRLGDDATFQQLARKNISVLNRYKFTKIVTADPHAFHCLSNEYGDLGGKYQVFHHTTFFADLIENKKLTISAGVIKQSLTYHDPCYLGRYNGEYDAPRYLLRAMGIEIREMQRSGFRSRCCGGGGGAPVTDIPGEKRIPDIRMADAVETNADIVAVACPQCTLMLEGVVEPRPQVKDVAELLVEALAE